MKRRRFGAALILCFGFLFGVKSSAVATPDGGSGWDHVADAAREYPCFPRVRALVTAWGARNEWELVGSSDLETAFQSPTDEIGRWIEIDLGSDRTVSAFRIGGDGVEKIEWNSACDVEISRRGLDAPEGVDGHAFDDDELAGLVKSSPAGLIYLWSPRFPLSMKAYHPFKDAADRAKVPFRVFRLDDTDPARAKEVARENDLPPSALTPSRGIELKRRGAVAHSPIVFAYSAGKIHPTHLRGFRDEGDYSAWIAHEFRASR